MNLTFFYMDINIFIIKLIFMIKKYNKKQKLLN